MRDSANEQYERVKVSKATCKEFMDVPESPLVSRFIDLVAHGPSSLRRSMATVTKKGPVSFQGLVTKLEPITNLGPVVNQGLSHQDWTMYQDGTSKRDR